MNQISSPDSFFAIFCPDFFSRISFGDKTGSGIEMPEEG